MQEEGSCACHMPTKEIVSSFVVSPGFSYDMCKYDYSGHAQAGLHIKAFLAWACVRDEKPATTRGSYEPRLLCVCVCVCVCAENYESSCPMSKQASEHLCQDSMKLRKMLNLFHHIRIST